MLFSFIIFFFKFKIANQMVTSNKTRTRKAQFSRNCIMEKNMLYVFQTSVRFRLRDIHFDMASEKTNPARYGCQTVCRAVARLKIYVIKFHYNNTEKLNRKKK